MTYLLDANACIAILNDSESAVATKLVTVPRHDVALCQMIKAELYFGAFNSQRQEDNLAALDRFFSQFLILPFDDEAARAYGRIRVELNRAGTPIGPNDLVIAATSLRHDATLVTHNTREFSRIRGLRLEDWQNQE